MVSAKQTVPICPKCGYDQRGEIATWESVCPLDGQCPECGLEFEWRDVFDPARNRLEWYVEHAQSLWQMIKRTPSTLLRLAIPYYYWRAVSVGSLIRLRVLAAWLLVLLVGLHIVLSIPYGIGLWKWQSSQYYGSLSDLYENAGLKGLLAIMVNGVGSPMFYTNVDYQTGSVVFGSNVLYEVVNGNLLTPMIPLFGMSMLWVIVLLAVPVTRRQAKLRAEHVWRGVLVSGASMVIVFQLGRLAEGLDLWAMAGGGWSGRWERSFGSLVMPAMVLWMLVFWATAIRVGWKIRQSNVLIVLGSVASLLGGVVVLYIAMLMLGKW